jgi:hypothetical protein
MSLRSWAWLASLMLPALALAQDRDESSMFGGDEAVVDAGTEVRPGEDAMFGGDAPVLDAGFVPESRDNDALSGPAGQNQFDTGGQTSDPLQIGGTLYMRYQANFLLDRPFEEHTFSAPSLLDVYLDARPSDRVRAFALGRLRYDPTLGPSGAIPSGIPGVGTQTGSNPSVALDQLWLRFDLLRKVYFTIGRQKVKWGVGRLWNPSDFLNAQKRDPLAPFDLRLGINAVKVHVPIESLGWNFYGYGLLDNNGPAGKLFQVGGALRAEILLGPAEVSVSGAWVNGRRPRYAVDASAPVGPVDVYAEVSFRDGADFTQYRDRIDEIDGPGTDPFDLPSYRLSGIQLPTTVGVAYSFNYTDSTTLVMGVEYFYNPVGASKPIFYVPAIRDQTFTLFYAGKHYVGAFVLAPGLPGAPWISLSFRDLEGRRVLSGDELPADRSLCLGELRARRIPSGGHRFFHRVRAPRQHLIWIGAGRSLRSRRAVPARVPKTDAPGGSSPPHRPRPA